MPTVIAFLMFTFSIVPAQGYTVTQDAEAVSYYQLAHMNEGADVLLAHDYLAGASFFELKPGDFIRVEYPAGMRLYRVTEIQRYTATMPKSVHSGFIGADGVTLSSEALVKLLYVSRRLILQTCYDDSAGRLFVITERVVKWAKR